MEPIRLGEHGKLDVALSEAQLATVRQELAGKVEVWPTGEPGRYSLKAGAHVGFAVLPEGLTLIIEPKVPIETLFALLARVYDPAQDVFKDQSQSYTTVEELFEFVVRVFAAHAEELVARGILRGYRTLREDLVAVRGRIMIEETLHSHPGQHHRHWCEHSQFSPDLPENRILRWTVSCLAAYRYREAALAARLRRLALALSDAELDPRSRLLFERLIFHRLNDSYRPALALARLLLDHLTFSGSAGREPFLAYLVNMNTLFERYVTAVLEQAARGWGLTPYAQDTRYLDSGRSVDVHPDVILCRDDTPCAVLDAKYKLAESQADVYQMVAYCHALEIDTAVLVHPAHEAAPAGEISVRGPGNLRVCFVSLALHGGPEQLRAQAQALVDRVAQLLRLAMPAAGTYPDGDRTDRVRIKALMPRGQAA